jgi:hypothetical protein
LPQPDDSITGTIFEILSTLYVLSDLVSSFSVPHHSQNANAIQGKNKTIMVMKMVKSHEK